MSRRCIPRVMPSRIHGSPEAARWLMESLAFQDLLQEAAPRCCLGCQHITRDPDGALVCTLGHGECPKMPAHLRNSWDAEIERRRRADV